MFDGERLRALFEGQEADHVERKRNAKELSDIRKAICAFANDLPNSSRTGFVFVGQEDDLNCANLDISDELLLRLSGLRDDGSIQPFPTMRVTREKIGDCTVAVIAVEPSFNPPVRVDGRVWVRVGPRRAQASSEEERRLLEKRRWGSLPFDAHGLVGTALSDLDLRRFELELLPAIVPTDVLEQNHRPLDQQLAALRLVTRDATPTVTGILFLGKSPLDWIPGAYIQFLRIAGTALTDPMTDQKTISGTLPDQVRQIDELLSLNVRNSAAVGGESRIEQVDYPIEALRQLVRNAIMHRNYEGTNSPVRITWYNDRVEIQSPGGPFGQVTVQNFGSLGITDYRNPTVAGLMKELRIVERFGVGVPIAKKSLADNGNPPLELLANEQNVLAVLKARQ
jgi:ATP-dependent DNA helicase RecG